QIEDTAAAERCPSSGRRLSSTQGRQEDPACGAEKELSSVVSTLEAHDSSCTRAYDNTRRTLVYTEHSSQLHVQPSPWRKTLSGAEVEHAVEKHGEDLQFRFHGGVLLSVYD
ncbi:hypothetical protein NDU88_002706, partial [Pleurodeles waltl]